MKHIALIGCGRIAFLLEQDPLRNKPCTHWGGIRAAHLNVTHACDIDPARLAAFGRTAEIKKENLFTRTSSLFALGAPDICVIAAWTPTHAPLTVAAADAGTKLIVCEKPAAASLKDARRMIDACKANGSTLIINHERRYDPRYRTAKKILESGRIGQLRCVKAFLPTGAFRGSSQPEQGGGSLLHDGTHLIDMIRFFAGDIASAQGNIRRFGRNTGFEDHASALLEMESGIPVFVETGGGYHHFGFGVSLCGTEGTIEIGNGYQRLFLSKPSRFYKGFRDLKEAPFPRIPKGNCFTTLYKEVSSHMEKAGVISSGAYDGYKALEAVHGIYLAAFKGIKIRFPLAPDRINIKKIFDL